VGIYVQIRGELCWSFCTSTGQFCKYETSYSMYLIWTIQWHWSPHEELKSLLDPILMKKYDNGSHWHVGSHVQISREMRWGFCTNTRRSCKYETTTSIYLMSTTKITLLSSWRTKSFIGPNLNEKIYITAEVTHMWGTMCK